MTVIAYRNGVMAADTRAYSGGITPLGQKRKIRRLDDGTLIGCSSNQPGVAELVMDWYAAGADREKAPKLDQPSFSFLAVKPDGSAFYADDRFALSGPITGEMFAIGSGRDAAQGAMRAGVGPERAVEIACEVDPWSALPVYALAHQEMPKRTHRPQDCPDCGVIPGARHKPDCSRLTGWIS